jgi:hypothetical protein
MSFSGGFGPAAVATAARQKAGRARVEVRRRKVIAPSIARVVREIETIERLTGAAGAVIA